MKLTYDAEADAAYLRLSGGAVLHSEEVSSGIILDYDREGRILGIELLDARAKLTVETLAMAVE
ncbi:MAG TPA: DUF2283 domain-containing protein [Xanthobacteraceae bacterium]|nr:DUF2283 domain-containing protein [Xanthobacteraceae bacterium]